MKIADLYVRVSTDEQAEKGYSQRDQEERLRKYCEINKIVVRNVIFEDHSAKTFNRPEWQKLLAGLRKKKGQIDLILFAKWDRFSRNAGDAYQMINILRKLGVEPQAVEQPLDLAIPENKMMLAFYLASPEVENDRRALNTFHGMRRARKEGRYMGVAPIGYLNKTSEDGKKYIEPDARVRHIIVWAFEELARGKINTQQVWEQARKKGLDCSRSRFWILVRNPVYCGKIYVAKYKDEEAKLVNGQHEPIISSALFYEVQDVLDGRKRNLDLRTKITDNDELVLRGFLNCPKCTRVLTGSASKGRKLHYHYYHCHSACGVRFKAPDANEKIKAEIKKYTWSIPKLELFKEVILSVYKTTSQQERKEQTELKAQLQDYNNRLTRARELLVSNQIDADDYRTIKKECSDVIDRLEAKLVNTVSMEDRIEPLWEKVISNLSGLDELYQNGNAAQKRRIIGSMFPENLTFDGSQYRTTRVNQALEILSLINKKLHNKKNRTNSDLSDLSCLVPQTGLEPVRPRRHGILSPACLPIPPPGQIG